MISLNGRTRTIINKLVASGKASTLGSPINYEFEDNTSHLFLNASKAPDWPMTLAIRDLCYCGQKREWWEI